MKCFSLKKANPVRHHWIRRLLCLLMATGFGMPLLANAATVNLLTSTSSSASGAGAVGKPSIANFTIPAGNNRILFIAAGFERDHCDAGSDVCNLTSTGAGLSDNFARPVAATYQITARLTGPGGSIDKKNALTVGGSPSGDLRFSVMESSLKDGAGVAIPNSTLFSQESYHIALFESEINTLLGGAASGDIAITLPDVVDPKSAGDDAVLTAFVFNNAMQTVDGIVRSSVPQLLSLGTGLAGDFTIGATAFDAGQAPNDAADGLLVVGFSALGQPSTAGGFNTMAGYTLAQSVGTNNGGGRYDNEEPTWNTSEPSGMSASAQFRNGVASNFTLQSAADSSVLAWGAWAPSFTISSDNVVANEDYSDAPATYGTPNHTIVAGTYLGATAPDSETAAQPSATASLDETTGTADEGSVFTNAGLTTGLQGSTFEVESNVTLHVPVVGTGKLYAWFDWDRDGTFGNNPNELVANGLAGTNQTLAMVMNVPLGAAVGTTYARFRFSSDVAAADPTAPASNGEVEDYQITLADTPNVPTQPSPPSCSASGSTKAWTAGGGGYQSDTSEGLTITATTSAPNGAKWTFAPNDAMNTAGQFGNPDINGIPSLSTIFFWDTSPDDGRNANADTDGKTGQLTFSFSAPVKDPVIYIDRLGGYGGNSVAVPQQLSNAARITPNAANAAATFTKVGGTNHFEVSGNALQRTPNEALVWGESSSESGTDSTRYTAMGGIQINGTYDSVSLDLAGTGVEGAGADGIEFVVCAKALVVNTPPLANAEPPAPRKIPS